MCGCRAKSSGSSGASRYAVSATSTNTTQQVSSTTITNASTTLTLVIGVSPLYRSFIPKKYSTGGGTSIKLYLNDNVSLDSRLAQYLIDVSNGQVVAV